VVHGVRGREDRPDHTDITVGPDGNLWFTEFAYGRVGRMTTEGNAVESPQLDASVVSGISAGPRGTVWFMGYFTDRVYRIALRS